MTQINRTPTPQPASPIARVPHGQVCIIVDGIDADSIESFVSVARMEHRVHPGSRVIISLHDDSDTAGSPYPRNFTLGPNGEMIPI